MAPYNKYYTILYKMSENTMVRLQFRGKKLADKDFWTKSDPFLVLSRPGRDEGSSWVQVLVMGVLCLVHDKKIQIF